MLSDEPTKGLWIRHPVYQYGILLVLAVLATHYVRRLMTGVEESMRVGYQIGFVSVAMLIANHISTSFLTPPQQRRLMPLQMTFMVACLGYVVVQFWQHRF